MIWLLIGYILARVELIITAKNYDNVHVGWGSIPGTLRRKNMAPMRYRVLVPWTIGRIKDINTRLNAYAVFRWLSVAAALACVAWAWDWKVALVTAAMIPVTFEFDYWNWPIELGAVALGMTGLFVPAAVGGVFLALSKETAPIVAVAYWSVTQDWIGAGIILALIMAIMAAVRAYQGKAVLYCERWMLWRNIEKLKEWRESSPMIFGSPVLTLSVTILIIVSSLTRMGWDSIVPLSFLAAGYFFALANETRIFVSAFPWIAAWILTL